MLIGIARPLIIAAAGLWLAGCTTSSSFSNLFGPKTPGADASASAQADETSSEPRLTVDGSAPVEPVESTGSVTGTAGKKTAPGLLGSDPNDELSLGKKQYRANNFGLAEKHFRLAVEKHPRDAEAWLGLAASYDRLRRFDLADPEATDRLMQDAEAVLGRVDILASSISHTAGYGLRSLPIIQSLSQLDATYGADVARTFITNHGASIVFTPREQRDAEEYSKMLGDTTVRTRHRSTSRGRGLNRGAGRNVSWNEAEERRPLMLPQEVKALSADKEIVFVEGVPHPILAEKIRYYRDGFFKKRLLPKVELPVIGDANRQQLETTPVMIPHQMMQMLEQGQ